MITRLKTPQKDVSHQVKKKNVLKRKQYMWCYIFLLPQIILYLEFSFYGQYLQGTTLPFLIGVELDGQLK